MKRIGLGPDDVFYRYLTPRWAFVPKSGAGAAADGGRFNRPGVEALYLSRAADTALAEYRQDASIVSPATLAAYKITVAGVVDFSLGFDPAAWPPEWAEWACAWKKLWRIDGKVPPSWKLSDAIIAGGCAGLLFPSTRQTGGINLVLYPQNFAAGDSIEVHDPEKRLPSNQSSWPD